MLAKASVAPEWKKSFESDSDLLKVEKISARDSLMTLREALPRECWLEGFAKSKSPLFNQSETD